MAMNFWLQQSIEINDDGIFMIYTTLDIPQIVERKMPPSSIHPKDAVIKRKYFLQVLCFIIPKLSRLQCLIHEARAAKKAPRDQSKHPSIQVSREQSLY